MCSFFFRNSFPKIGRFEEKAKIFNPVHGTPLFSCTRCYAILVEGRVGEIWAETRK